MDWTTFSHPKQSLQEFKDKNYTYTANYSGGLIQIRSVENK